MEKIAETLVAVWHVMDRGPRRLEIFREERDYRSFLYILKDALYETECELWGYCLMPNHYHLMILGTKEQVSKCMWRLNYNYARTYNDRYGHVGHAFDAPYKAYMQKTPFFTLRKLAYIFLNPVKGGLASRPEDYPWSGYKSFMGLPGSPIPIESARALSFYGQDLVKARGQFLKLLDREAKKPQKAPAGGMAAVDLQAQEFAWLNEEAHRTADKFDEEATVVAMYWADLCGIRPRAIAKALGEPTSDRVRTILTRFRKRRAEDPDLQNRYPLP